MEQLLYDARLAARNLRRRASTSAMIVLTLATGVACTTAMFSVVRGGSCARCRGRTAIG